MLSTNCGALFLDLRIAYYFIWPSSSSQKHWDYRTRLRIGIYSMSAREMWLLIIAPLPVRWPLRKISWLKWKKNNILSTDWHQDKKEKWNHWLENSNKRCGCGNLSQAWFFARWPIWFNCGHLINGCRLLTLSM